MTLTPETRPAARDAFPPLLADPALLPRIAAALACQGGPGRGWAMADAARPDLPWTVVHLRPWLKDPEGIPGLRSVPGAGALAEAGLPPDYALVLLAEEPGTLGRPALAALRAAVQSGRPQLCLFGRPGGSLQFVHEGELLALPAAPFHAGAAPLTLGCQGKERREFRAMLPATLRLRGAAPQDSLLLRAEGFDPADERFELRSRDGSPLGEVTLRLDFRVEGGRDRLLATVDGADRRIEILRAAIGPADPRKRRGPSRLHLLFDRTTLDQENWQRALEAVNRRAEEEAQEAFETSRPRREKWNLALRRELAAGLQATLRRLGRTATLDLWWFADAPRPGIAAPDGLPIAPAPWGHRGERRSEKLSEVLLEADFDYACGMDLFDAVDEALEQVVRRVGELGREQHAVLIVGDSPPPPEDEDDPLWQRIVEGAADGAPRTNARRSPRFRQALVQLGRAQVPVGWLFVRQPRSPEAPPQEFDDYSRFQTLREKVRAALEQQPGLLVEGCDGAEDLARSLGALFSRMKRERGITSQLSIEEA